MNIEEDIFDYLQTTSLEPHDDYTSEITYKDQKIIWNRLKEQDKEIERLNNKVEELMTLYTTERNVKEDYKTIIDKAIEYIKVCKNNDMGIRYQRIEEILQGSDK